jgi:hypothetical protein
MVFVDNGLWTNASQHGENLGAARLHSQKLYFLWIFLVIPTKGTARGVVQSARGRNISGQMNILN